MRFLILDPTLLGKANSAVTYLDFLVFLPFVVLVLFRFNGMQPQPQDVFLPAIAITSFLFAPFFIYIRIR